MEKKKLGRTQAQSGTSSPLANERTVYDYDSGSISSQKSYWIRTFRILIMFHLIGSRSHHTGMETSMAVVLMRPSQGWWGWHLRDVLWMGPGAAPPSDVDTV